LSSRSFDGRCGFGIDAIESIVGGNGLCDTTYAGSVTPVIGTDISG